MSDRDHRGQMGIMQIAEAESGKMGLCRGQVMGDELRSGSCTGQDQTRDS